MRRKFVSEIQSKLCSLTFPKWLLGFLKHARFSRQEKSRVNGTIKWFDNKKGFGFITPEIGQDVFVHHSSIAGKGFKTLNEGDLVTFEIVESAKGLKAQNVQKMQK